MEILDELPCDTGFLLMVSLRSVMLWVRVPPGDRAGLYLEGAEQRRLGELREARPPGELHEPLAVLAHLLDAPDEARPEVIGTACRQISCWAEDSGHPATSYLYLRAGALADGLSAELALGVGRAAQRRGDRYGAESWLQQAVLLARLQKEWDCYVLAHLELGHLQLRSGIPSAARRVALRALRALDRGSAGLPLLAHDVAYLWLQAGHPGAALRVFEAIRPLLLSRSLDWLFLVANIARAAGACGQADGFATARAECLELCEQLGEPPGAAAALLELAQGASALGAAEEAREMCARAAALAVRYHEDRTHHLAAAMLAGAGAECLPGQPHVAAEIDRLARELSAALRACPPFTGC